MKNFWLDNFSIDNFIINALKEDMYYGDITTDSICASLDNPQFKVYLMTRTDGILAGSPVFIRVFEILANYWACFFC